MQRECWSDFIRRITKTYELQKIFVLVVAFVSKKQVHNEFLWPARHILIVQYHLSTRALCNQIRSFKNTVKVTDNNFWFTTVTHKKNFAYFKSIYNYFSPLGRKKDWCPVRRKITIKRLKWGDFLTNISKIIAIESSSSSTEEKSSSSEVDNVFNVKSESLN